MIEIPRSCRYYLEACREAELKEDHPTALRMLGLALHYADNSDDEFEFMAEKLRIFDLLGADVPAVCYESIARRADGDDMYMALFNNAVVHKNAEQAAYYLDILESDDEVPLITAVEHGKAKEDEGLARVNKLIAGLEREYRMSDIGFADAEEEYVGKVLEKAVSLLIASHGKEMSGVEEALQLRTDSPKLKEKINEVLAPMSIQLESFGQDTLICRQLPSWMSEIDEQAFLQDVIDLWKEGREVRAQDLQRHRLATIACHHSIRFNRVLSLEEMQQVIEQLARCRQPYHCPHGRPTFITITEKQLIREFQR